MTTNETKNSPFGDVIYQHTRAQAIEDGMLIDVTETAREAGITFPTALTAAVWERCVAVPEKAPCQDEMGRLWDVLTCCGSRSSAAEEAAKSTSPWQSETTHDALGRCSSRRFADRATGRAGHHDHAPRGRLAPVATAAQ